MNAPSVSVVVPSYRRPDQLRRCLTALGAQRRAPLETLVVVRAEDEPTRAVALAAAPAATVVPVVAAGMVAALNAGRAHARGDVIAFTDDDSEPHPDWIERIAAHFAADARLGAVGGRDIVHHGDRVDGGVVREVGRLRWWGRRVGHHHCRSALQDVQFLKGVNMAFRAAALEPFDTRLWGDGAEVHNDLEASLSVWRRGWRVVWDPAVAVDHRPGPRFGADGRERRSLRAEQAEEHNELYALLRHVPPAWRPSLLAYKLLIGSRIAPGLAWGALRVVRLRERRTQARRTLAFAVARARALGTLRRAGAPTGARPPREASSASAG